MHDYDIWYKDRVIANIKAGNLGEATRNAKAIYGDGVTVEKTIQ